MGRFSLSGARSGQHWFRLGSLDVTTTVLVTALGVLSLVVYAVSSSALGWLAFDSRQVTSGQVWRLVSWPLVNPIATAIDALFIALALVIFWWLGSRMEQLLGSRRFLRFLILLVLVPAVAMTVIGLLSQPLLQGQSGMYVLETGVIVAFAATYPRTPLFFTVPAWIVAIALVGIDVLELVAIRDGPDLLFMGLTIVVSLLAARAFGLSRETWIPRIPLPELVTGDTRGRDERRRRRAAQVSATRDADINALLDKIAQHGIHSLSSGERKRLEAHSRQRRGQ